MESYSMEHDDFVFMGSGGSVTSDEFVRLIRRRALQNHIQDDDRLIAQTAASHVGGAALIWYEDLSEEVQESWKLLRRAVLARWPVELNTGSPQITPSSSSTLPTPAAAPPPARPPTSPPVKATTSTLGPNTSTDSAKTGATSSLSSSPTEPKRFARALYSYTRSPSDPNEVDMMKGEIVEVTDSSGKWWQIARSNGETGIAPSNYLVISTNATKAELPSSNTPRSGAPVGPPNSFLKFLGKQ